MPSTTLIRNDVCPMKPQQLPRAALGLLLEAAAEAEWQKRVVWEFALDLASLERAGATGTQLRGLICQGVIQHAEETTTARSTSRTFRFLKSLALPPRACFVLTASGVSYAGQVLGDEPAALSREREAESTAKRNLPRWDRVRQVFIWNGTVLKRFHRKAPHQQTLLNAFEQRTWPGHLENPLTGESYAPVKCLRDTVRALNSSLEPKMIMFSVLDSGDRVGWQRASPTDAEIR
jgi:hypothetical protein